MSGLLSHSLAPKLDESTLIEIFLIAIYAQPQYERSHALLETPKGRIAPTPVRKKRKSLEELKPQAREEILTAAAVVVSEHGYAKATTKRIADAAGISEGTIYLYFKSRQAIFDQLLPHAGKDMIRFISDRIAGSKDIFEIEERGFRAFFEYSSQNKGFFRILSEAEVSAPKGFDEHFQLLATGYRRALERGVRDGLIKHFDSEDLEVVIYMFMGARTYLHLRFMKHGEPNGGIPEKVVKAYMRMVRCGLR